MKLTETGLPGAFIVQIEPIEDERGFFARSWCAREFAAAGLHSEFVQCNISWNRRRGTLRGMHFQAAPHEETKLVRCTRGSVFDVVADPRPDSPTFGQWVGVELSAANRSMLYIGRGLAHGFQTLEPDSELFYQMGEFYAPGNERGFRWDDPTFGIEWPAASDAIISPRDRALPLLA
jgi:dTDP-4-dehydrorhamnose 3,5-epimerase